jgi:hypothetical protein
MSVIEDIKNEIIRSHKVPVSNQKHESDKKPKSKKKAMTKAEIEAYKQKMIEREESRYLGKASKDSKGSRKCVKQASQVKPKEQNKSNNSKQKKAPDNSSTKRANTDMPRILQPLEPLYLLRIPGLPKGDCLAICYARGVDT